VSNNRRKTLSIFFIAIMIGYTSSAYADAQPFYAKIIKLQPFNRIVWKIYSLKGCGFSTFQEFGLRAIGEQTLFEINHYQQPTPALAAARQKAREQDSGISGSDRLGQIFKQHLEQSNTD